jgi:very-short-patch-repair endonuclease
MGGTTHQAAAVWALAAAQHGVVARRQLLALGFTRHAVAHRMAAGRLHPVHRGVYAVGRPDLTLHGRWMAAVLACGPGALLSHDAAAGLWAIAPPPAGAVDVSVPGHARGRDSGIVVHRRPWLTPADRSVVHGIPVTSPVCTLVDLAARRGRAAVEAAINEADKRDVVDPETLRAALDVAPTRPGLGVLREVLDRRTFTLTDSELERRFLPIARRAGLSQPKTGEWLNGFRVDFHWPELGLVVETDGLRYHRTAAQQARDRLRDQAHTAAGLTPLRFTRAQVRYEPEHVQATLAAVAGRLGGR